MSHDPLRRASAIRYEPQLRIDRQEMLADETPIALVYNGHSHAVMMVTPDDLDDFAVGFTLAEGIVDASHEIEIVDRLHTDKGISLQMLIPQRRYDALRGRERSLTGRTGCGLCGTSSLEAAVRPVRRLQGAAAVLQSSISSSMSRLGMQQPLNAISGSLHAAALLIDGGELLVREDVGRHNAVDKVIGAAARQQLPATALLVTSRASYEIVHKAAQAGIHLLAAVSAPTALAVRVALEAGVTLIGFARDKRMTVYAHPQGLRPN